MITRAYFICAYVASWFVFGAVGLAFNVGCAALLLLPGRAGREQATRAAIRILFAIWVAWLRATGLVAISWHGTASARLPRRAVYVANHPGLLDATFLLARLPDAVCIFKPGLRHSPFLAPAAIAAGYLPGDTGVDLVREIAQKVADGCTVLIFPEGTRTDAGVTLNAFKPGFALIARRAGAPVQVMAIEADRDLLPRSARWWSVPHFPARVAIHVDRLIAYDPDRPIGDLVGEVERRLLGRLAPAV